MRLRISELMLTSLNRHLIKMLDHKYKGDAGTQKSVLSGILAQTHAFSLH